MNKVIRNISKLIFDKDYLILAILILIKVIFQITIVNSGYKWLSSDDYCRTVKSFEWLENPIIYSGVWLSPHFWLNGFVMIFIKDLFLAATLTNVMFSTFTVYYFYKISLYVFDKKTAIISSLVFIFFPFQVWLSLSGLPESVHFFFIIGGIYYAILYKENNSRLKDLILATIMFMFGNMFRYEGWLFTIVFVIYIFYLEIKINKKKSINYLPLVISCFSFVSIFWWIIQNYLDHGSFFYFASETNKIFEDYGGIKVLQRFVQYPVFIFYIAPITSFFAIKVSYDCLKVFLKKKDDVSLLSILAFFNIAQLLLLMLQGLLGTGGTNMISRYIVINAILFIPIAVWQIYNFKKWISVSLFAVIIAGNIVWSFNYPNPFREDTYETGKLIRSRVEMNYIRSEEKIYFEEIDGYFDVFAVQTISNYPSKFKLGNFPILVNEEIRKKKKNKLSNEELNILDIKSYLEKNKISMAVVKSDSYSDKLKKLNFQNEEIGDYKIFYIRNLESNINDSSITVLADKVINLNENSNIINFNKTIAVKEIIIDNSNFGFNPQTVSIKWASTSKNILDSIDYEEYEFDRYNSVIELRREDNDSLVYTESKKIFSERNIEDLLSYNEVKNIIVIKPFALIYYSKKFVSSPFESGIYNLSLKVYDSKRKKSLTLYKGDSLYKPDIILADTTNSQGLDSIKIRQKNTENLKKLYTHNLKIGNIIAFFPNTNINKLVGTDGANFYRIITKNGLQVFFSQRHQADHFLNFVFNYF